jgi:hypothetical protein
VNWKQFLKLDWRKIVITVVIFIMQSLIFLVWLGSWLGGSDLGLPFVFYRVGSSAMGIRGAVWEKDSFSLYYLVVDLIIWYILSCLIVWIYDKFRKKKMKKV